MSKRIKQILILAFLVLTSCAQHGILALNVSFDDPVDVVGLTSEQLNHFLGKPALVRSETTVEMWQYRGKDCTLFIYLSPDESGKLSAEYAETRAKGNGDMSFGACTRDTLSHKL